jgi:hypothetical protein
VPAGLRPLGEEIPVAIARPGAPPGLDAAHRVERLPAPPLPAADAPAARANGLACFGFAGRHGRGPRPSPGDGRDANGSDGEGGDGR